MRFISFGCSGAYPTFKGACSSYFVQTDNSNILFDIGSGSLSNMVGFIDPCDLDAIFISHWHADHCSDLFTLSYFYQYNMEKGKKIKLYTLDCEESLFYKEACKLPFFEIINISEGSSIVIKDTTIKVYKAVHPIRAVMFKIENNGKTLLYTGDTNLYDGIVENISGSDAIISTAFFLHEQWNQNKPQLSAYLAAKIAKEAGVGKLYITHLNPKTSKKLLFDEAFKEFKNTEIIEQNKLYTL